MESYPTIDYNRFPKQSNRLYTTIDVLVKDFNSADRDIVGDVKTPVFVARDDLEDPHITIYKTSNNIYMYDYETSYFDNQNTILLGKKVVVSFSKNATKVLDGLVVRDDIDTETEDDNGRVIRDTNSHTFILLEDNRLVRGCECNYGVKVEPNIVLSAANPLITYTAKRLSKIKASERPAFLHGLYKQVVPGKSGKFNLGIFNDVDFVFSRVSSDAYNFINSYAEGLNVVVDKSHFSDSLKKAVYPVVIIDAIEMLRNEMSKYPQFEDHVRKLNNMYLCVNASFYTTADAPFTLN